MSSSAPTSSKASNQSLVREVIDLSDDESVASSVAGLDLVVQSAPPASPSSAAMEEDHSELAVLERRVAKLQQELRETKREVKKKRALGEAQAEVAKRAAACLPPLLLYDLHGREHPDVLDDEQFVRFILGLYRLSLEEASSVPAPPQETFVQPSPLRLGEPALGHPSSPSSPLDAAKSLRGMSPLGLRELHQANEGHGLIVPESPDSLPGPPFSPASSTSSRSGESDGSISSDGSLVDVDVDSDSDQSEASSHDPLWLSSKDDLVDDSAELTEDECAGGPGRGPPRVPRQHTSTATLQTTRVAPAPRRSAVSLKVCGYQYVLIVSEPQSGKTYTIVLLTMVLLRQARPIEKVVVIMGSNNDGWKREVLSDFIRRGFHDPDSWTERHSQDEQGNWVGGYTAVAKNVRVWHLGDLVHLRLTAADFHNTAIFWDEPQDGSRASGSSYAKRVERRRRGKQAKGKGKGEKVRREDGEEESSSGESSEETAASALPGGGATSGTISRRLEEWGFRDFDGMKRDNKVLIALTATPDDIGYCWKEMPEEHAVVKRLPVSSQQYYGVEKMLERGRLQQSFPLIFFEDDDSSSIAVGPTRAALMAYCHLVVALNQQRKQERLDAGDSSVQHHFHLVRPTTARLKSRLRHKAIIVELIQSVLLELGLEEEWEVDTHDFRNNSRPRTLTQMPRRNTILLLTQFYRCANRVSERHLLSAFEYCPTKSDGWVVQSLVGRSCGWGKKGLTWVFSEVEAAKRYLAWMRADCEYGVVGYTGSSIRTVPGGTSFIHRAKGTGNSMYSDRSDACVDELNRPGLGEEDRQRILVKRQADHQGELRTRTLALAGQKRVPQTPQQPRQSTRLQRLRQKGSRAPGSGQSRATGSSSSSSIASSSSPSPRGMASPFIVDTDDRVERLPVSRFVVKVFHVDTACADGIGANSESWRQAWSEMVSHIHDSCQDMDPLLPSLSDATERYVAQRYRPPHNLFVEAAEHANDTQVGLWSDSSPTAQPLLYRNRDLRAGIGQPQGWGKVTLRRAAVTGQSMQGPAGAPVVSYDDAHTPLSLLWQPAGEDEAVELDIARELRLREPVGGLLTLLGYDERQQSRVRWSQPAGLLSVLLAFEQTHAFHSAGASSRVR